MNVLGIAHFLAGVLAPFRDGAGLDFGEVFREEPADFFPFFCGSGVGSGSGGARGSRLLAT